MAKKNCWEVHGCGRQPGGERVAELGVCPAAVEPRLDGTHGGKNAGRACWAVAGTLCGGTVRGVFAAKYKDCLNCSFYKQTMAEEGLQLVPSKTLVEKLKKVD
jgi:hypothetical protein